MSFLTFSFVGERYELLLLFYLLLLISRIGTKAQICQTDVISNYETVCNTANQCKNLTIFQGKWDNDKSLCFKDEKNNEFVLNLPDEIKFKMNFIELGKCLPLKSDMISSQYRCDMYSFHDESDVLFYSNEDYETCTIFVSGQCAIRRSCRSYIHCDSDCWNKNSLTLYKLDSLSSNTLNTFKMKLKNNTKLPSAPVVNAYFTSNPPLKEIYMLKDFDNNIIFKTVDPRAPYDYCDLFTEGNIYNIEKRSSFSVHMDNCHSCPTTVSLFQEILKGNKTLTLDEGIIENSDYIRSKIFQVETFTGSYTSKLDNEISYCKNLILEKLSVNETDCEEVMFSFKSNCPVSFDSLCTIKVVPDHSKESEDKSSYYYNVIILRGPLPSVCTVDVDSGSSKTNLYLGTPMSTCTLEPTITSATPMLPKGGTDETGSFFNIPNFFNTSLLQKIIKIIIIVLIVGILSIAAFFVVKFVLNVKILKKSKNSTKTDVYKKKIKENRNKPQLINNVNEVAMLTLLSLLIPITLTTANGNMSSNFHNLTFNKTINELELQNLGFNLDDFAQYRYIQEIENFNRFWKVLDYYLEIPSMTSVDEPLKFSFLAKQCKEKGVFFARKELSDVCIYFNSTPYHLVIYYGFFDDLEFATKKTVCLNELCVTAHYDELPTGAMTLIRYPDGDRIFRDFEYSPKDGCADFANICSYTIDSELVLRLANFSKQLDLPHLHVDLNLIDLRPNFYTLTLNNNFNIKPVHILQNLSQIIPQNLKWYDLNCSGKFWSDGFNHFTKPMSYNETCIIASDKGVFLLHNTNNFTFNKSDLKAYYQKMTERNLEKKMPYIIAGLAGFLLIIMGITCFCIRSRLKACFFRSKSKTKDESKSVIVDNAEGNLEQHKFNANEEASEYDPKEVENEKADRLSPSDHNSSLRYSNLGDSNVKVEDMGFPEIVDAKRWGVNTRLGTKHKRTRSFDFSSGDDSNYDFNPRYIDN